MNAPPLLFDLDGTLLHTLGDITASVNAVRRTLGVSDWDEQFVMSCIGDGLDQLLRRSFADWVEATGATHDPDWLDAVRAQYREHYAANVAVYTKPFDGVETGLARLADRGHQMAIVSNKPERFCVQLVEHFRWQHLFPVVVGGDSAGRKKPHPAPVAMACEMLSASVEEAWMIGDSPGDIESGARAGCPQRLAATWGYRDARLLAESRHTGLVADFGELLQRIENE